MIYHTNKVCFRYIIVNTVHKGDNKDDDDDDNNNIACRVLGLMTCSGPINSFNRSLASFQSMNTLSTSRNIRGVSYAGKRDS